MRRPLKLCFYGDDFTGSTDVLEQLDLVGVRAMLFIQPPTLEQLQRYPEIEAVGIAGQSRAMKPAEMMRELTAAFLGLKKLGAPQVHYKVCSTFDSSPEIGSIGTAIDIGAKVFPKSFVPVVAGAPRLGRYCAFGNLFARYGIGTNGQVHRLDRHPSISKHPVTPMTEADLVQHLGKQTRKKIGLFDVLKLALSRQKALSELQSLVETGANKIVLFDVMNDSDLACIGELMEANASVRKPLFSVGSSGVEAALGTVWQKRKTAQNKSQSKATVKRPVIVACGSCSPVSINQINWALKHRFKEVKLDVNALGDPISLEVEIQRAASLASKHISKKHSVIIHTDASNRSGVQNASGSTDYLGTALGEIIYLTLKRSPVQRLCIAGGDTSGQAAKALGFEGLQLKYPLAPGAPICKAFAPNSPADGLEVIFKGGQVGAEDFFQLVVNGKMKAK